MAKTSATNELKLANSFELAKTHISWSSMRSILKDLNITLSIGWDKTYEKIVESYKDDELVKIALDIEKSYVDSIHYGNKVIRIAKVDEEVAKSIISKLKTVPPDKSPYLNNYPYPIDLSVLKTLSILPELVEVYFDKENGSLSLIYSAKRHYFEKESFEVEKLGESIQKVFNQFETLVALKSVQKQGFDIVRVHQDGYIEVAADLIEEIGLDDHRMFIGNLLNNFQGLLKQHSLYEEKIEFVSLFSLLDKLYDEIEGRIVEIGHDTGVTGGVVTEKMRRKTMDVRDENFHKGGMEASNNVSLFSLAKTWSIGTSNAEPELYLPGSIRSLSQSGIGTYEAILKGCITKSHYEFIISKIKKYSVSVKKTIE